MSIYALFVFFELFSFTLVLKIKFLFNIDIMGDAADGITLVNGTVMASEYNKINAINDAKKYIPSIQKEEKQL